MLMTDCTLDDVYRRFPTRQDCIAHIESIRWKGAPVCPYCSATLSTPIPDERRHHCNVCNASFSATVGTLFHGTRADLQKWFCALHLILNSRRRLTVRWLATELGLNRNTTWRMAKLIGQEMTGNRRFLEELVEQERI